jgi:hypothetical protein
MDLAAAALGTLIQQQAPTAAMATKVLFLYWSS